MIICSYYTAGTEYKEEAEKLIASCEQLKLRHIVKIMPDRFDWNLNTKYKPGVILQVMQEYQDDVLFVDADATFHAVPNKLLFSGDVSAHVMDKAFWKQDTSKRKYSLMSGTLWFPNNNKAKELLFAWEMANMQNPQKWDQHNLESVLGFDCQTGICNSCWSLCNLPHAYCAIDKTMPNVEYAVIRHHQASRRLKKTL